MIIIGNDQQEFLCHPGTNKPYRFETEEQAEYIIKRLNLEGAHLIDIPDTCEQEERYGGQNDLW